MNLNKINEKLTNGMIGLLGSIILLSITSTLFPILTYVVAFAIIALMITMAINFGITTYLLILQINVIVDKFFKLAHEQGK